LKHHLSEFIQVAGNEFVLLFDTLKHRFIDFTKVFFKDVYKARNEFSLPFSYLKNHLSNFVQVSVFYDQDAENEFVGPFITLEYRFIELTKVVF
jgi:hypothetical protein